MILSKRLLLASAACIACAVPFKSQAETITKKTVIHQKNIEGVQKTNFKAFDLDNNGILSMNEVGEKLFYIFDTDGNEVIDNIEFNNEQVMTIIPMEKDTYTYVDWDDDNQPEQVTYTYETFIEESPLMRFDEDMDGLSPADFIESSFLRLDDDDSKAIELDEWKEAYIETVIPENAKQERYN
jgi:hypothetical protein